MLFIISVLPVWAQKCSTSMIWVTLASVWLLTESPGDCLTSGLDSCSRERDKTDDPTRVLLSLIVLAASHLASAPLPLPRPLIIFRYNFINQAKWLHIFKIWTSTCKCSRRSVLRWMPRAGSDSNQAPRSNGDHPRCLLSTMRWAVREIVR